jgi:hypothetical protein
VSVGFATLDELVRATNLPAAWVLREAKAGRLPHFRAGRRLMFDIDAVRAALLRAGAAREETLATPHQESMRGDQQ